MESHCYFLGSITHVLPFQLGLHFVDRCNNSSVQCSELITHRLPCMIHLIPTVKIETGNVSLGKSFISAVCKSCSIPAVRTAGAYAVFEWVERAHSPLSAL